MPLHENVRFFAATDVGRVREHNEDNYLIDKRLGLFIVADGMGGHAAGEVASALAVRTIHEEVKRDRQLVEAFEASTQGGPQVSAKAILNLLEHAVQRASARIHEEAQSDSVKRGMGTTVSCMLISGNTGFIAHVGDSRVYMMRAGKVDQITEDHTVYNELVRRGKLSKEQIEKVAQKNAITRAVGVYERVEVDTLLIETIPGDAYLICSDGLHGYVDKSEELLPFLRDGEGQDGVDGLIDLANERGGKDNVTGVVIRVGETGAEDADRVRRLYLKREVLSQMPLFAKLSDREHLRIMQLASVKICRDGDVIIKEGDRGDELFIVLSGSLRVSRGDALLKHFKMGDHFGEMALIRNTPRSATVTSEGVSELIVIRRADFFEILRREHELAVKLLWQFLGEFADRLDHTSRDLRIAREELAVEDLSSQVYPEVDMDEVDDRETLQPSEPRTLTAPEPRVTTNRPITVLCLASYYKGTRFLETCKKEGCTVLLLTLEKILHDAWPRESIDEIFALPGSTLSERRQDVINAVSYLARTRQIDRVVPLDDYDVEVAAMLREHMRLPGMGESTARYFRDKLAMRERAHDNGVLVPPFVGVLNHDRIREYLEKVPGPWVFKPRSEAASLGIKRIQKAEEVWPLIEELGDRQSAYLIEKMIPGDVYHVDAITSEREIVFANASRYRRPILSITQEGGVFGTRTVLHGSDEEKQLLEFHKQVLSTLGFVRGVSHTEFIRSKDDGKFYFLETAARAGGAHITDLVDAATGVNLWEEWAKIEIRQGKWAYDAPKGKNDYAGLIVSLAREQTPDTSAYNDPEIVWRMTDKGHHVGLIVRSPSYDRVTELMDGYEPRIARDFQATLPPPEHALD